MANTQRSMAGPKRDDAPSVLLAHRYGLVRHALGRLLTDLGFEELKETDSHDSLLRLAAQWKPAIVLVEWELIDDVDQLLEKLSRVDPRPAVVVLVPPHLQEQLQPALKAGVNGYLSLNITPDEFEQTLRLLSRGGVIVSSDLAAAMASDEEEEPNEAPGGLSGREREVLGLVASGATNREIAEALVVTENTVKVHLRNVLDKLHLRNRQQAAAFAVREGIVVDADIAQQGEDRDS